MVGFFAFSLRSLTLFAQVKSGHIFSLPILKMNRIFSLYLYQKALTMNDVTIEEFEWNAACMCREWRSYITSLIMRIIIRFERGEAEARGRTQMCSEPRHTRRWVERMERILEPNQPAFLRVVILVHSVLHILHSLLNVKLVSDVWRWKLYTFFVHSRRTERCFNSCNRHHIAQ